MLVLLPVTDVIVINHFLNQLLYSQEGVHLLGLRKGFNLAYMSFKLRFINLLNVLLPFI